MAKYAVKVQVWIAQETKDALEQKAREEERTLSQMIRIALKRGLATSIPQNRAGGD